MTLITWLVVVALGMGLMGLVGFLWSMKSGQLDDLDGAAQRVLLHELEDTPLVDRDKRGVRQTEREGERDAARC